MRDRDRRKVSATLEPEMHERFEAWRTARSLPTATALLQMVDQVLAASAPALGGRAPRQDGTGEPSARGRPLPPGVLPVHGAFALPGDLVRELDLVRRTNFWKELVREGEFVADLEG